VYNVVAVCILCTPTNGAHSNVSRMCIEGGKIPKAQSVIRFWFLQIRDCGPRLVGSSRPRVRTCVLEWVPIATENLSCLYRHPLISLVVFRYLTPVPLGFYCGSCYCAAIPLTLFLPHTPGSVSLHFAS
jgi:hypothetical protein